MHRMLRCSARGGQETRDCKTFTVSSQATDKLYQSGDFKTFEVGDGDAQPTAHAVVSDANLRSDPAESALRRGGDGGVADCPRGRTGRPTGAGAPPTTWPGNPLALGCGQANRYYMGP